MRPSKEEIKRYYDENLKGKLDGYIYGNARIEKAWQTILEYGGTPKNILEIGCGVGDICARMSTHWKKSFVTGLDISEKSIHVANRLFASERLNFIAGILDSKKIDARFDLVVLMDVYEHIAANDRTGFHQSLKELITDGATIIMSFPTPDYLDWLRKHEPSQIQPVDEHITLEVLNTMAEQTGTRLLFYKHVNVWRTSDYAHAILGSSLPELSTKLPGIKELFKAKLSTKISKKDFKILTEERKQYVKKKLGKEYPF